MLFVKVLEECWYLAWGWAAQQSLHVSLQGRGSSGHFPRRGPALRLGHCHWGPNMEGEALQGPRAQAWSQQEMGGAPRAAPPPSPQGPPSLAQGPPSHPPSGHPVFSGAAPSQGALGRCWAPQEPGRVPISRASPDPPERPLIGSRDTAAHLGWGGSHQGQRPSAQSRAADPH